MIPSMDLAGQTVTFMDLLSVTGSTCETYLTAGAKAGRLVTLTVPFPE